MDGGQAITLDAEPEGQLAARLVELAAAQAGGLLFVARSETRAQRLVRAAAALAPADLAVVAVPAWDCMAYDRTSPSREVMGLRMDAVHRLSATGGGGGVLAIAGVESAMQRLPPPDTYRSVVLRTGEAFDAAAIGGVLAGLGYLIEEMADRPGEAAMHGAVVDVFPPGTPNAYRIEHADGRIAEIRAFDPATQRSRDTVPALTIGPASELPEDTVAADAPGESAAAADGDSEDAAAGGDASAGRGRGAGAEHALAEHVPGLVTLFDLVPRATLAIDPEVDVLREQRWADIADAFEGQRAMGRSGERTVSPPAALYLDDAAWTAATGGRTAIAVQPGAEAGAAGEANPPPLTLQRIGEYARAQLTAGRRIGIAGPAGARRTVLRALGRRIAESAVEADGWLALRAAPPGTVALLRGTLDQGFATADAVVLAPSEIVGAAGAGAQARSLAAFDAVLAPGDAVIHVDHGMGMLTGIETVEQADCVRLGYAGKTGLLVTADEIGRIWRYGAEAAGVKLDRLNSESWPQRRAAIERDIAGTADRLVALARARAQVAAPSMRPDRAPYGRFAERFGYSLTPDQADAIAAVEHDLGSGRPMERLVCGDVGYGKTEVALRAAAMAALAGWQVAMVAPTTVLVRQHIQTFQRRFGGLGVTVAGLSRLEKPARARAVKQGLADGSVGVVIGTQALAAKDVRFAKLGLLIVDEEQRFGARQKTALRALRQGVHVLTLTATPIPRTLQAALTGLQQLSVLATPPARRQPVRTVRAAFDPGAVAQALRREARRGGQSFIVCPQIEDLAPMREQLGRLTPDLDVLEVHGEMPPEDMDAAMVRFANGDGDVLLSTNIVESGLDVPRANTMLVWRADRFGLAQLHQLRGRVGRGRLRGVVYLLTEPGAALADTTAKRLDTLVRNDRLGAGFAISARDLDLRGAGDLLGEDQAGHVKLIGVDLYRHMLRQALRVAHGEAAEEAWSPAITLGVPAFLPPDYIGDAALRVSLHARIAGIVRNDDPAALDRLEEEIDDRFGPPPEPVHGLLAMARLQAACHALGVAALDVGPDGAAASLRSPPEGAPPAPLERSGDRLVLHRPSHGAAQRVAVAEELLEALEQLRAAT